MLRRTTGGRADGRGSLFRRCLLPPLWDQSAASSQRGWRFPLSAPKGVVVGVDISPEMLTSARAGLSGSPFLLVAADG